MAHYLARRLYPDFEFLSAGVAANPSFPIPSTVIELLKEEGIQEFEHTPKAVSAEDVEAADLILTMEKFHKNLLEKQFPEAKEKIRNLKADGTDIPDPIGGSEETYRKCLKEIKEALKEVVK